MANRISKSIAALVVGAFIANPAYSLASTDQCLSTLQASMTTVPLFDEDKIAIITNELSDFATKQSPTSAEEHFKWVFNNNKMSIKSKEAVVSYLFFTLDAAMKGFPIETISSIEAWHNLSLRDKNKIHDLLSADRFPSLKVATKIAELLFLGEATENNLKQNGKVRSFLQDTIFINKDLSFDKIKREKILRLVEAQMKKMGVTPRSDQFLKFFNFFVDAFIFPLFNSIKAFSTSNLDKVLDLRDDKLTRDILIKRQVIQKRLMNTFFAALASLPFYFWGYDYYHEYQRQEVVKSLQHQNELLLQMLKDQHIQTFQYYSQQLNTLREELNQLSSVELKNLEAARAAEINDRLLLLRRNIGILEPYVHELEREVKRDEAESAHP